MLLVWRAPTTVSPSACARKRKLALILRLHNTVCTELDETASSRWLPPALPHGRRLAFCPS